jgi:anaerobic selenocysteine-containing dehydrogenase
MAYGHYYLQLARPAVPAPGECKSNVDVFRLLARRMGFEDACFGDSVDDMIRQLLDSGHDFLDGITLERLEREHFVRLNVSPAGEHFLPHASGRFFTPSGKCEFHPEELDYVPPAESRAGDGDLRRRYPLECISPKNDDSMNSTFGHRPEVDRATAMLNMHHQDAQPRGIADGDLVRVFNDRGSIRLQARVDGVVRQGVVSVPSVRWGKVAPDRRNVNALTSDRLTDAGGGPVFYSCLVQVEKCGD